MDLASGTFHDLVVLPVGRMGRHDEEEHLCLNLPMHQVLDHRYQDATFPCVSPCQ
jgi:hypothetical protein